MFLASTVLFCSEIARAICEFKTVADGQGHYVECQIAKDGSLLACPSHEVSKGACESYCSHVAAFESDWKAKGIPAPAAEHQLSCKDLSLAYNRLIHFRPGEFSRALYRIEEILAEETRTDRCGHSQSVFAFDLDGTVIDEKSLHGVAIRSSDKVLNSIQEKLGIPVIAITSRKAVNPQFFHQISTQEKNWSKLLFDQATYTLQNVAEAGISLRNSISRFDVGKKAFFNPEGDPSEWAAGGFSGFFRMDQEGPFHLTDSKDLASLLYYKDGVLLTSQLPKGKVFRRFLDLKGLQFHCIFFADDENANITAMQEEFPDTGDIRLFSFQVPKRPQVPEYTAPLSSDTSYRANSPSLISRLLRRKKKPSEAVVFRGIPDDHEDSRILIKNFGADARRMPDDSFILGSPVKDTRGNNENLRATYNDAEDYCVTRGGNLPTTAHFRKVKQAFGESEHEPWKGFKAPDPASKTVPELTSKTVDFFWVGDEPHQNSTEPHRVFNRFDGTFGASSADTSEAHFFRCVLDRPRVH